MPGKQQQQTRPVAIVTGASGHRRGDGAGAAHRRLSRLPHLAAGAGEPIMAARADWGPPGKDGDWRAARPEAAAIERLQPDYRHDEWGVDVTAAARKKD